MQGGDRALLLQYPAPGDLAHLRWQEPRIFWEVTANESALAGSR